jgi:hypothetical protein
MECSRNCDIDRRIRMNNPKRLTADGVWGKGKGRRRQPTWIEEYNQVGGGLSYVAVCDEIASNVVSAMGGLLKDPAVEEPCSQPMDSTISFDPYSDNNIQ